MTTVKVGSRTAAINGTPTLIVKEKMERVEKERPRKKLQRLS
jgi:hypothetical protein